MVARVDHVSCTPLARGLKLGWVDVHRDNASSACTLGGLNDSQTHSPQAKDSNAAARCHLGSVEHGPPASGHATAEEADLLSADWKRMSR